MSGSQHVGYFEDPRDLIDAARECRLRGIPILDVISPFPLHGIDQLLGIRPSRLPWVTLIAGAIGLGVGFGLEYWSAAVNWPLNVGGKPMNSLPAFVPVAFELTILFAGLATAAALCLRSKLWPCRRVLPGLEPTSDDRHALILAQRDAAFLSEDYVELLRRHGAVDYRYALEESK